MVGYRFGVRAAADDDAAFHVHVESSAGEVGAAYERYSVVDDDELRV